MKTGLMVCYTASMRAALFYAATISFAAGILIRSFTPIELPAITAVMLAAFALVCVGRRAGTAPVLLVASVTLCFASLGMLRYEIASWYEVTPELEAMVGETVTLEGYIDREPDVRETTMHLYLDVGGAHVLAIVDRFGIHRYGDRVRIEGELAHPEAFTTDLGRTFNYPGYLRARGVSYVIRYGTIERIATGEGSPVIAALLSGKHAFMRALESLVPEPEAGLGEGLLLGAKRALGSELEAVFRATGIIHIVVLSGYNIMLVVAFVMYCLAHVMGIRARAVFGVCAIAAFAILVGLSATVLRASVMAGLLLYAQATGRTYAVMRALMVAGCAMLCVNPYLLAFDTGFQLSFLATMGLVLLAPHIEARLSFVPLVANVREFLTATLATQVFVLPLLLYQVGEFSVVSVVVNVLVLPMVPVAMLLTFAAGMLGLVSATLALPLAVLAQLSLAYIIAIAEVFAMLPFASYAVPAFSFWLVPLSYGAIGYALWRLRVSEPIVVRR